MSSSTPVVRQLRVRALRVPMPEPHRTASGIVSESPLVLADLTVDGGAIGRSIVFTYTAAAVKPTADLMANLEPLIVGQPLAPAELTRRLAARRRHRLARRRGPGRRAWAPRLHPPVAGSECAPALGDAHGSLAGVRGLVESHPARAIAGDRRHGTARERRWLRDGMG